MIDLIEHHPMQYARFIHHSHLETGRPTLRHGLAEIGERGGQLGVGDAIGARNVESGLGKDDRVDVADLATRAVDKIAEIVGDRGRAHRP